MQKSGFLMMWLNRQHIVSILHYIIITKMSINRTALDLHFFFSINLSAKLLFGANIFRNKSKSSMPLALACIKIVKRVTYTCFRILQQSVARKHLEKLKCVVAYMMFLKLALPILALVAERLRALFLNHLIISPLYLVWVRAPLLSHVRQAKFCLRVCQMVFLGFSWGFSRFHPFYRLARLI